MGNNMVDWLRVEGLMGDHDVVSAYFVRITYWHGLSESKWIGNLE